SHLGPLAENLAQSLAPRRALVRALGLFALVAALLAALGVYGLTAYSMGERRRELGLRLALGADRSRLLAEVLSRSLAPVLAGLGVGLLLAGGASLAAGRRLASLAATRPGDLATLVLAALALLVLALAASWAPARKATATSPATTLTRLE
ncbi:MAG TPA: FtsX-like permease family protein, partial [Thermoanaerobaculia bacterium]|nr:FtsX-like permease family protein [Thermoanaerobaculia bacterium]